MNATFSFGTDVIAAAVDRALGLVECCSYARAIPAFLCETGSADEEEARGEAGRLLGQVLERVKAVCAAPGFSADARTLEACLLILSTMKRDDCWNRPLDDLRAHLGVRLFDKIAANKS